MEELRMPWNDRDGLLYGGVIACITAYLMVLFNTAKVNGLDAHTPLEALICLPAVWVVVMLLMSFLVGKVANNLLERYLQPSDSVNARIVANIVVCVTMMSAIMSALGPVIGTAVSGHLSFSEVYNWPRNWPVNFFVAFWIEMLLAQPAARAVMKRRHIRALKARGQGAEA